MLSINEKRYSEWYGTQPQTFQLPNEPHAIVSFNFISEIHIFLSLRNTNDTPFPFLDQGMLVFVARAAVSRIRIILSLRTKNRFWHRNHSDTASFFSFIVCHQKKKLRWCTTIHCPMQQSSRWCDAPVSLYQWTFQMSFLLNTKCPSRKWRHTNCDVHWLGHISCGNGASRLEYKTEHVGGIGTVSCVNETFSHSLIACLNSYRESCNGVPSSEFWHGVVVHSRMPTTKDAFATVLRVSQLSISRVDSFNHMSLNGIILSIGRIDIL